jgi:hypothetical protein
MSISKLNEDKFSKLSDINQGEPYKIIHLESMQTKFGKVIIAKLEKHGNITKIFLPKRFQFNTEFINQYNSKENFICLVYLGLQCGRHEIRFI